MQRVSSIVQRMGAALGFGGPQQAAQQDPQFQLETQRIHATQAAMYFDGYAPKTLALEWGKADDNLHINYAETIVAKTVAFLFGNDVKITIGTGETEDQAALDYLNDVWPEDARSEDFTEAATEGAISGDVYLKISIQASGRPRVSVLDPSSVAVVTDPHDVTRATMYVVQYEIPPLDPKDKPLLYREITQLSDDGQTWRIQAFNSYDGGNAWVMIEGSDVTWNFPFPPISHCKNLPRSKSFYGRPDLRHDVLMLIQAIARLDSLCNKTVRVHSTPKPYATGLRRQDMELGTDKMMFLPAQGVGGVEPKVGLIEMKGDMAAALAFRKVLREGLAEMTKVPEVATGKMENAGQLSGIALQILYGPLMDHTRVKQRLYGKLIKDTCKALLAVGNQTGDVQIHWTNPLPADEQGMLEGALIKKSIGISDSTIQAELGYDADEEREKSQNNVQDTASTLLKNFDQGAGAEQLPQ